ncbi:MAG: hypothetical protein HY880_02515 [Deltaproteobacteria bacterium]|nr:hypothetical protein [Deltaproteobacteria bacterium]
MGRPMLRILVVCLFMVLAKIAEGKEGLIGMSLPSDFAAFSVNSPWNTPIPKDARIDPYSKDMIKNLKAKAGFLKGDMTKWNIPLFVIDYEKSPKTRVYIKERRANPEVDPDDDGIVEDIPMPEGVWPDPESDGHMTLVDPVLRREWDFSTLKQSEQGAWLASRVDVWDLNGSGYRTPFAGKNWWMYGARGSGMPLIAGLIRPEEIAAGEIRHALVFASPVNRLRLFGDKGQQVCSPPASRTDAKGIGFDYIPEGARLQLDPALDIDTLNISKETKVIARALQKYGMYNADNSPTFKLYLQNLGHDRGAWKDISDFNDLRNIPVERFRVLSCSLFERP